MSILRNSADAIFTLDSQERITTWNKGAEAIFGYSEEEMLGQSLDILLPPYLSEKKELEQISRISRNEGFLRSYQTQRLTKDRQLIDVIFTRTAIKDPEGKLIGFSSVLKDVTEQKSLDRHLAQMESFRNGELTAGLAHEINHYGIKGAIEIICDSLPEDHPHCHPSRSSEVRRIDRSDELVVLLETRKPDFVRTDPVELFSDSLVPESWQTQRRSHSP
jgi:PAS domain S-box-containing protein